MKMTHPEIEAVGEVLDREQFNAIYAPRGWTLVDEATSYANDQLGRFVRSADDLTKDEARALIAARGGDYPDAKASENEVRTAYAEMFAEGPARPAASTETATGVPIKPYDPSEYNYQEVIAHLGEVDADEQARIIAAEAGPGGKNRVTITGWTPPSSDDSAPAGNQDQE